MQKNLQLLILIVLFHGLCPVFSQTEPSLPVVAVLDFNNTTKKFYLDELQKSFPSLLKTELSQKRSVFIVERQKIEAILKEQDFVLSDLSEDKDKQAKVGSLIGADYVITGDISENGKQIRIDVAITKISNGQVVGEKAMAPSKEHIGIMARMLAQNIVHQLTGEGKRLEKVTLRGAPTGPLLISSLALGAASAVSFAQKKKFYKEYHDATSLKKINDTYKRANNWNKAAYAAAGLTALSAGAYIIALIKNKNSQLEVLAEDDSALSSQWSLQPELKLDGPSTAAGIKLSLQF
jgi:TolB-like protein